MLRAGRPLAALFAASVALGSAGCGGGDGDGEPSRAPGSPQSRRADPAATRVIRAWSDALRNGDIGEASSYFALPSVVQNGTPPIRLERPIDVRAFNVSLPCGARLLRTYRLARFTAAVFRLTDRPGGDCGPYVGEEAVTAFVIRRGAIVEWRRLPDALARPPGPRRERPAPAPAPAPDGPEL